MVHAREEKSQAIVGDIIHEILHTLDSRPLSSDHTDLELTQVPEQPPTARALV